MMKQKTKALLIAIILIGVTLRFWQLGVIPTGLNNDEVSYGYNAYSILKTGKDEWGKFLPIDSLQAFGDFKLPVYVYLSIPILAIFDLSAFSIRLPSALGGIIALPLVFFLMRLLTRRNSIALLSALFLALSPYHTFISRKTAEHNVAVTISIAAVTVLYLARRRIKLFPLAAFIFLLQAFTYTPSRGFALLLFLALILLWHREFFTRKTIGWVLVGTLLFFAPVLSTFLKPAGYARLQQSTASDLIGLYNQVDERRGFCRTYMPDVVCRLFYSRPVYRARTIGENYVSHFSTERLFVTGTGEFDTYAMSKHGLVYMYLAPFLFIGLAWAVAQKKKDLLVPVLWLLLSPIPSSLVGPGHAGRMTTMLPSFQMLSAMGMVGVWMWLRPYISSGILRRAIVVTVAALSIVSLGRFGFDYIDYNTRGSRSFKVGNEELFAYLRGIENEYKEIFITDYYGEPYIFYLFFNQFNPRLQLDPIVVDRTVEDKGEVGFWTTVSRIGKYHFYMVFSLDMPKPGELWVLEPGHNPGVEVKHIIKDLRGEPVFLVIDGQVLHRKFLEEESVSTIQNDLTERIFHSAINERLIKLDHLGSSGYRFISLVYFQA